MPRKPQQNIQSKLFCFRILPLPDSIMQNDIKLTSSFIGDKCTSIKFLIMRNLWIKNRELKLSPYKWTVCLLQELLEIVFHTIEEVVMSFKLCCSHKFQPVYIWNLICNCLQLNVPTVPYLETYLQLFATHCSNSSIFRNCFATVCNPMFQWFHG